jgi:tripartite-type tricarboxylate transporter receptor subunit TctC
VIFIRSLVSAIFIFSVGIAAAQNYPAKPVRVVIPWPPGGANDIAGRIVMQKVAEAMGQQFPIDNRGGAGGTIGADLVAKAAPDGYTLMAHSTTHVGNAHLYKKLPYDTLGDFAPVGLLTVQSAVLTVHPSLPVKTVRDFVALARARPGEILYSTAGNGSIPHLGMALLGAMTQTQYTHVPYKGGAQQVIALVAGESQASIATVASVVQHIRAGRLRALGLSATRRSSALPEIPTIAEAGVPGYDMSPWIAVFAPAATPRAIIDRLNTEINRALKLPDVVHNLSTQGLDPWPSSSEEFSVRFKTDFEKYERLIRMTGAKVD